MIQPAQVTAFLSEFDSSVADAKVDTAKIAMQLIAKHFTHYKWVGIYWLRDEVLELGPYVGAPTDHTHIKVGQGVCGTAVAENANQIVADVRERANYLACSLRTRSEIVVLIRRDGKILGQIDADGDEVGAFDKSDEELLTEVAERLAAMNDLLNRK